MSDHHRLVAVLLGVSSLVVSLPAGAADAPVLPAITERMEEFVEEGQIAGAVTLVVHDGEVVLHGAVGKADIEADRPMRPDTLFAIASMTKPIAATAVMILVDEGKVSLDDPVSKYVPEFKETKLRDGTVIAIETIKEQRERERREDARLLRSHTA